MKKILLLFFIMSFPLIMMGQKSAFTIEDLYKLKGVGDPQISPDGKMIAYIVTESFLEKGKSDQDIWIMKIDGSDATKLTDHSAADNHPRWSADSKNIYFISTRKNGPQLWQIPITGGEPNQMTDFPMGIADPELSPNNKTLLFASDIFPDCPITGDCNKFTDSTMTNGPLQAHMADDLLYRHWTDWKDGKRTHVIKYDLDTKMYSDLTPGNYDSPAWEQGGIGFTFSPDGEEICFVSNRDVNQAESTNKDLFILSLKKNDLKNITQDNKAYDGNPQYSPDGKYIAYKYQTIPAYEADKFSIGLYNRKTGERTKLTDNFDNWVNDFIWSPDSKNIYFTAQVQGHVPIFKVELKSKSISKILDIKTIDAFSLAPNGKQFIFTRRAVSEPVEIWSSSADGKDVKRLTFINKEVSDRVDIRPAEEMWISSPTGKKIHTFIVKPHNFDPAKKYPLILNVHGGPQSQWADAFRGDWQVYPGSGYIVAFPNPHGSTGYGQEFTAAISKDWGGKVYEDVMAVADSLENISWVDKNRIGAMGWSYGGYMMMWLEGHTNRFKAIVSMMGVYNLTAMHGATEELWFPEWDLGGTPWESDLYQKWSPNNFVKNFKTPCLVITGERDYRVPYTQSLEFFTHLQKMKVSSRLIVFPNDGHWPSGVKSMPLYYNAHLDWFHKYLGGDPAPYDMTKMIRNQAFIK
jgi:dipeptidyl aminopeptidase/acylaminoacyl peptidase